MASRFRNFFESIVYAGMKPAGARKPDADAKPGRFAFLTRLFSEPVPDDPLYLTHQTTGQKVRRLLRVAIPLAVVVCVVALGIFVFGPKKKDDAPLSTAQIAQKLLPNFVAPTNLGSNHDIELMEVHFDYSNGGVMSGSVKNNTDHTIQHAEIVLDIADAGQSQLGAVVVKEADLAPGAVRKFEQPIDQKGAAFAVVREVRTQ